jgi:hypothetical protein
MPARSMSIAIAAALLCAGPAAAAPPEPQIAEIVVRPFDLASGRLGADLAAADGEVVVNWQAGDTIAKEYLVSVVIAGQPNLDLGGRVVPGFVRRLRIETFEGPVAARAAKPATVQLRTLRAIPESGRFQVHAVVEPGGCRTLTVRATLIGSKTPATRQVAVPFVCQN